MGADVLRVYQEDWFRFRSLPAALREFTERTGIRTELAWDVVGVGTIEHMFDKMVASFTDEKPAFDVVCCDEIILRHMASEGGVLDLAPRMRADGITLDHVTPATVEAVTLGDTVLGLPCVNVCSMLLCRRDYLERYGLPVPASWQELQEVARTLQEAVRRDEKREFYGFETRGAPGGGHAVWSVGSFTGAFGVRWIAPDGTAARCEEAHRAALEAYVGLIREVCPPDQASISFVEMRRDYAAGRVGIIMDVGMEYAHIIGRGGALADASVVAMVPAGPAGRAPNLYCPAWAIPARTDMPGEAWELVKFLTSDARLERDGLESDAVETSSLRVLYGSAFDRHFRPDLLTTVRASRAVAREERPFGTFGMAGCEVVGDTVTDLITGKETLDSALRRIETTLAALVGGGGGSRA
ncbi:MAG: extracellular solute-binding protein [Geminicoccaceae bacterium]|nr:extracellular solute-binding protein [Geminicoccaceae bacterium]